MLVGIDPTILFCKIARLRRSAFIPASVMILLVSHEQIGMSIQKVSIRQLKAARALLGWSQEDLARIAGVSLPTVKRLESADGLLGGRAGTIARLKTAIESAGIEFLQDNGGIGVRLGSKKSRTPKQ